MNIDYGNIYCGVIICLSAPLVFILTIIIGIFFIILSLLPEEEGGEIHGKQQ